MLVVFGTLSALSACSKAPGVEATVMLPEGDPDAGAEHFVELGCNSCHSVVGADIAEPEDKGPVRVLLGSRSGRTMTYGALVTAVVNPSHKLARRYRKDRVSADGESMMRNYNDTMTVTQLTDIVAFLQGHYEKAVRPGYKYPVYEYKSDEPEGEVETGEDSG